MRKPKPDMPAVPAKKFQTREQPVYRKPLKTEKRAAIGSFIQPELGEDMRMTAQEHSMMMNDGTTNPHRDALSFDAVTPAEMGNLNDNK
jgi:hypothetical protein